MGTGLKFPFEEEVTMRQGTNLGSQIGKWIILAVVVAAFAALLTASVVRAQEATIEYAENSTDPVATFTATDPEGDQVTWGLAGDDADEFDISEDGVLTFDVGGDGAPDDSVPPDFEAPGDDGGDNTYEVTVTAMSPDGAGGTNTDMEVVTVEVTDLPEDGKVTWTVAVGTHTAAETLLTQFTVGAELSATVADGDGIESDTERYQWYRSSNRNSQGTLINNPSAADEDYTVVSDDVDSYIRVVAYYYEDEDPIQKSVYLVSDQRVLGNVPAGNDAPEFDPDTVAREVNEGDSGKEVGARVTATGGHGKLVYTLTGTDNTQFEIDEKTGQIKTMVDLNYEATTGDNQCSTPNECAVTVTATDSAGRDSDPATVNIEINSVDEKPYFDSDAATGIQDPLAEVDRAEGEETVVDAAGAVYTAYDPDMGSVNYDLLGADRDLFTLNASQRLRFKTAPDHENPMDRNGDNVYEVTVQATDGTMDADWMVKVTVTDVNEDPMIGELDGSIEYPENGENSVATFTATDPEGDQVTWGLAGDDADEFDISEDGVLTFDVGGDGAPDDSVPPDFEAPGDDGGDNTYEVTVTAMSPDGAGGTNTDMEVVTVEVTDLPEDGKVTWTVAVGTHTAAETLLTQFTVGAELSATVADGDGIEPDTERYQWYRSSNRNSQGTLINNPSAADEDYTVVSDDVDSYIRVVAWYAETATPTKQKSVYLVSDQEVLGNVPAGNDAPEFDPDTVAREVNEGDSGKEVGARVTATGGHGKLVYTLTGTDNTQFEIDEKTGQIKTMVDLNYEATTGDNQCSTPNECAVTVTATDSAGRDSDPATVNIEINSVDEKPYFDSDAATGIQDPLAEVDRAEGEETVVDAAGAVYTAYDPDMGSVNYDLLGADRDLFTLNASQRLRFKTAPDHENPMDRNGDNVYEVTVQATDGTMDADWMVKVTVTDVNEDPMIVQGGLRISGSSSTSFSEGEKDADAMFKARGPMEDMAGWTLDGADARYFSVDPARGAMTELMFRSAPDYEMPRGMAMSDTNTNTYMVTLKANDGTYMDTHGVTVMVTNMEELGELTADMDSPISYMENGTDAVATYTADGPMADMATWTLEGDDAGDLSISNSGVLTFDATPDYEMAMDEGMDNTYMVTVKAEAGGEMAMQDVTITVTDVNEMPEFAADTATREVQENSAAGAAVGDPVTATDADSGDTLTYTLSGDDAMYFTIDSGTGQIMVGMDTMLDYEAAKTTYMVTVTATDSEGLSDTIDVTINVTGVNEAPPEFAADTATREVPENSAAGAAVGDPVTATDADSGDTLAYTLSGDDMYFTIDNMGQIMVGMDTMLDYEAARAPTSVTVTATDSEGLSDTIDVTINVTNVNEEPVFATNTATLEVPENTAADMAIGEAFPEATDPDAGDSLTYSLGGDDKDSFDFDAATRQIKTKAALDYEDKSSYSVMVIATDSGDLTGTIDVTINVTDVNEAPMFAEATAARSIDENSPEGTPVGDPVMATDPDAGDTLAYSLSGDDAMYFSIDDMGQIMVGADAMLDYEDKSIYSVMVIATDGGGLTATTDVTVTINVKDVNEAPMFDDTTATRSIDENSAAGTAVGDPVTATDPDAGDTLEYSLRGGDAMYFSIDSSTGQITVGADAMLDYETKMSYMVTVTATDPDGETDTIEVTINVTDVEENPLLVKYDGNKNGKIDRSEVITAIRDYFADPVSFPRADVIKVIRLYFSSLGS